VLVLARALFSVVFFVIPSSSSSSFLLSRCSSLSSSSTASSNAIFLSLEDDEDDDEKANTGEKNKEEELSPTDAVCFRRCLSRFLSYSLRKASSFSVFRVGVMKNLLLAAKHEIRTNTRTRAHLFEKGNR
jgi:hypothetical protein